MICLELFVIVVNRAVLVASIIKDMFSTGWALFYALITIYEVICWTFGNADIIIIATVGAVNVG